MMDKLNLPTYDFIIKKIDEKTYIYDKIRRKYLVLTPEEWVRQHFINLLLNYYGYSKNLLRLEKGLYYNHLQKRTDILVFDRAGKPFLLVECKAAAMPINQAVIAQASRYNWVHQCPFLVITNGLSTFCFKIDYETGKYEQLRDLPEANQWL